MSGHHQHVVTREKSSGRYCSIKTSSPLTHEVNISNNRAFTVCGLPERCTRVELKLFEQGAAVINAACYAGCYTGAGS